MSHAPDSSDESETADIHYGFRIVVPPPSDSELARLVGDLNAKIYQIKGNNRIGVKFEPGVVNFEHVGDNVVGIYPVGGVMGRIQFYTSCQDHPFIEHIDSGGGVQIAVQGVSPSFYIHSSPLPKKG